MRPLLRFILFLFNVAGLNPLKHDTFGKVRWFFACITGIVLLSSCLLHIAFYWEGMKTFSEIYMFPTTVIFVAKLTTLLIKHRELSKILNTIDEFWPTDKFDENAENKVEKLHRNTSLILSSLYAAMGVTVVLLIFGPLFMTEKALFLPGYYYCDLQETRCFTIVHTYQCFVTILHVLPAVMGFDGLYICLIGEGYAAVELLKFALKNIMTNDEDDEAEQSHKIREFCEQHSIVLNFINQMSKFYSDIMLVQSWASLGALIFLLYMVTSQGIPPALGLVTKYGGLFVVLSMQFFAYCFGGAIISEQSLSVADEAYSVDWWKKTQPKLRKKITFIIQRSQKAEKLTVGKMLDLNLECFVTVLKNVLSIYGLLLTIEKKQLM